MIQGQRDHDEMSRRGQLWLWCDSIICGMIVIAALFAQKFKVKQHIAHYNCKLQPNWIEEFIADISIYANLCATTHYWNMLTCSFVLASCAWDRRSKGIFQSKSSRRVIFCILPPRLLSSFAFDYFAFRHQLLSLILDTPYQHGVCIFRTLSCCCCSGVDTFGFGFGFGFVAFTAAAAAATFILN